MTSALTTLRGTIATALANSGVWSVYAYPPSTILKDSVIIAPDSPYLSPSNNSQITDSPMANFKIIFTTAYLDNEGNLNQIEAMMVAVFTKLAQSGLVLNISEASAPAMLDAPAGVLLASDFSISTLTTWS